MIPSLPPTGSSGRACAAFWHGQWKIKRGAFFKASSGPFLPRPIFFVVAHWVPFFRGNYGNNLPLRFFSPHPLLYIILVSSTILPCVRIASPMVFWAFVCWSKTQRSRPLAGVFGNQMARKVEKVNGKSNFFFLGYVYEIATTPENKIKISDLPYKKGLPFFKLFLKFYNFIKHHQILVRTMIYDLRTIIHTFIFAAKKNKLFTLY